MSADRNLLFGILAFRLNFVTHDQLVKGMNKLMLDKSKTLGQLFVANGEMDSIGFQLLDALVEKHIEEHGGDVGQSLRQLSSVDMQATQMLGQVQDMIQNEAIQPSVAGEYDPETTKPDEPYEYRYSTNRSTSRFRIIRPHARGGLGEVFVAIDKELSREVALKEIQDQFADNTDSRMRFLREAEITGNLEHPGIVPVYGLGQYDSGRPFYAMRFIRGESLKEAIEAFHGKYKTNLVEGEAGLELRRLLRRLVDVCNAIAYAHSRGVLHRDLKPGNIILGKYGETLVVDWGLAKAQGQSEESETSLGPVTPHLDSGATPTMAGSAIGTPAYMSPEQAGGNLDELNGATDVYSLGATLFQLLTGQHAVAGMSSSEILRKALAGDIRKACEVRSDVPKALEAVCLKAMSMRVSDRYASTADLADDIEKWLADEPVSAYVDSVIMKTRRWVRRNPTIVSTCAVCTVLGLCAALMFGYLKSTHASELAAKNLELTLAKSLSETALSESREHLWQLRIEEAKALAATNTSGHRTRALESLAAAAEYRNTLDLRNEAFACMLLIDCVPSESRTRPALGPEPARLGQTTATHTSKKLRATANDGTVKIDGTVGRELNHPNTVESVLWSPSGRFLVTGCIDSYAYVWHVESGKLISSLPHVGRITHLCFCPSESILATVSYDGYSRLWDPVSGDLLLVLPFGIYTRFDSTGTQLVGANGVSAFDLLGTNDLRMLHHGGVGNRGQISDANVLICDISFSQDSRYICTAGIDGAYVWDVQTGKQLHFLEDCTSGGAVFLDDGDLITHGMKGLIRHKYQRKKDSNEVTYSHWSESEEILAATNYRDFLHHMILLDSNSSSLVLVEPTNNRARLVSLVEPRTTIELGPQKFCWFSAIDPLGKTVITTSWAFAPKEKLSIWDRKTGKLVHQIGEDSYATCVFSPDGKRAVFGSPTRYIVRETDHWQTERTFNRQSNIPGRSIFSHDGKYLALLPSDNCLQIISTQTWDTVLSLKLPGNQQCTIFKFSPDGNHLAILNGSRRVALLDLRSISRQLTGLGLNGWPTEK